MCNKWNIQHMNNGWSCDIETISAHDSRAQLMHRNGLLMEAVSVLDVHSEESRQCTQRGLLRSLAMLAPSNINALRFSPTDPYEPALPSSPMLELPRKSAYR